MIADISEELEAPRRGLLITRVNVRAYRVFHVYFKTQVAYDRALKRQTDENAGRENHPHGILGAMCLRVIADPSPTRQTGQPYSVEEIDYFWARVAARINDIPIKHRRAVQRREPSPRLQRVVMNLVDQGKVLTATGRLRAGASYCARHNILFQGLAADGAKLALWKLWRAGYRLVNFLHDEVIVEVPEGDDLRHHAETIRQLMVEGMREVVPDVSIEVEYAAAARWYKSAHERSDAEGRLLLWEPPLEQASNSNTLAADLAPIVSIQPQEQTTHGNP
jgi:hypothetical protein